MGGSPVGPWPVAINTNGASSSSNVIVKLVFDGTEGEGVYYLKLNSSGGIVNNIILKLEVASLWAGNTNAVNNWSSGSSPRRHG